MKYKIILTPIQAKEFFKTDEDTRIGMFIQSRTKLGKNSVSTIQGVVESYTVSYGEVSLICEGDEVIEDN